MDNIKAVAFDIDGTLYPEWALNVTAIPHVLRHLSFFFHYRAVRSRLHEESRSRMFSAQDAKGSGDFFQLQAERLAAVEHSTPEIAKERIHRIVYRGLMPLFHRIKPFPGARDAVSQFKAAGLKIGLLSDFPPEQKGNVWGIAPLCDVILGTEKIGELKPSPLVFEALRAALGVEAAEVLYVGNSLRSDIRGARAAGMKTAWIRSKPAMFLAKLGGAKKSEQEFDFSFTKYSRLVDFVLH